MKKAKFTVPAVDFIRLLKLPANVEVDKLSMDNGQDNIEIIVSGEGLPVQQTAKGKRMPTVLYELRRSWHRAKLTPTGEVENETKKEQ